MWYAALVYSLTSQFINRKKLESWNALPLDGFCWWKVAEAHQVLYQFPSRSFFE